jgi:hypothetical protein
MGDLCSLYPRRKSRPGNPEWHIDTVEIETGSSWISKFIRNVATNQNCILE